MKVTMKTENGKWIVNNGERTITFENGNDALYFVTMCHKLNNCKKAVM